MNLASRIQVLSDLGKYILEYGDFLQAVVHRTEFNNAWFTKANQKQALFAIAEEFLNKEKLEAWLSSYEVPEPPEAKTVGLVLAGNIPLVGFHDVLCVFVAGHHSLIKLSDKDRFLLPHLVDKLKAFNPDCANYFTFTERLAGFDAVIATGSNNSARYFEEYFKKYPHIIRKNRHAVAVLSGKEKEEEFEQLGNDIFRYFGLGCRNVSKIYLPKGFDFTPLMEKLHEHKELVLHSKYKNNFDYNFALFQLNKVPVVNNGCVILHEEEKLTSRIATLHYEFYENIEEVEAKLKGIREEIQLVVSNLPLSGLNVKQFGEAQQPGLKDYADGADTMAFLVDL